MWIKRLSVQRLFRIKTSCQNFIFLEGYLDNILSPWGISFTPTRLSRITGVKNKWGPSGGAISCAQVYIYISPKMSQTIVITRTSKIVIEIFDSGKDVSEEKLLQPSLEWANSLHRNVPTALSGIYNERKTYKFTL